MRNLVLIFFFLGSTFFSKSSWADKIEEYQITIKNHQFTPKNLEVPVGKRVKLIVENLDSAIEEFHSDDLRREKIITPNKKASIVIGPLKPGVYRYMGEFHAKTAQGTITAK